MGQTSGSSQEDERSGVSHNDSSDSDSGGSSQNKLVGGRRRKDGRWAYPNAKGSERSLRQLEGDKSRRK